MANSRLRLRSDSLDDVPVISSCLQDAIARIEDMTYIPHRRRFAMVLTRFRWELAGEIGSNGGERVRCGVYFDDVLRVQTKGIDPTNREGFLILLAVTAEEAVHGFTLKLHFAGEGTVGLESEAVNCYLSDLDRGWLSSNRPNHDI